MNPIQRCWQITDLIKLIGSFKHDFEHNMDIQKLNNTYTFQHLIPIIFYLGCVKYNTKNGQRMRIQICKCNPQITVVQFDLFEKRKRIQFYHSTLFLINDNKPLDNQRLLSEWILNDSLLLDFFRCSGEVV